MNTVVESENESDHADIGTPRDYSECMYRFYLELADCSQTTKKLIEAFLPQHHRPRVEELTHCFEFEMPIQ